MKKKIYLAKANSKNANHKNEKPNCPSIEPALQRLIEIDPCCVPVKGGAGNVARFIDIRSTKSFK